MEIKLKKHNQSIKAIKFYQLVKSEGQAPKYRRSRHRLQQLTINKLTNALLSNKSNTTRLLQIRLI